jgi:D-alanyl-D-alanine carboxypeptidase
MASLTKIMTCLVSIQLATEMKIDIRKHWLKVSRNAACTTGTTANLAIG